MAWVEDVSKRTRKEKHFYDASTDTWKVEGCIHDQHYKDDLNQWQDVDENLVTDGQGGFARKCEKTRHIFRVANGGARRWYPRRNVPTEYVDITQIQYWSANRWRTLNLPTPVWKNNGADWDMTNLYASIVNTWHQVKVNFILKNANAYTRLRFAMSLVGLAYNHTTGTLTSLSDGTVCGYIRQPTAQDATEADVPVTSSWDGAYIEWSVNTTGKTFPINIDPTFTDGPSGDVSTYADTIVRSNASTSNFGTTTFISLLNSSNKRLALLNFNVDSIPDTAIITDSKLYVYVFDVAGYSYPTYAHAILAANSGWVEGTKDGANEAGSSDWDYKTDGALRWAGDAAGNGGADAGCSVAGTDYNATEMGSVTRAVSAPIGTEYIIDLDDTQITSMLTANYGIILRTTQTQNTACNYCSSDHATAGYRPKLVITYTTTITVNLTVAQLTAGGQSLTITPGAVSKSLGIAQLTASGQVLSVSAPPVATSINLGIAQLVAGGQSLSIQPGAVSVPLSSAQITAGGQTLTPQPGAVSIALSQALLSASGQSLTPQPGAVSIALSVAQILAGGQSASIQVGGVTISLLAAQLVAGGQAISVGAVTPPITINLAAATLQALGQTATLQPGAVSIALSSAILSAAGQILTSQPGAVSIALGLAQLSALGQVISVSAPFSGIQVNLSAAQLTASGQILTPAPGAVSINLDTAALSALGQALTLQPGAVSIPLDAASLVASGQALSLVLGEVVIGLDAALLSALGQVVTPLYSNDQTINLNVAILVALANILAVNAPVPPAPTFGREHKVAHYICPLSNSLLCGSMPMCALGNCMVENPKNIDPYARRR